MKDQLTQVIKDILKVDSLQLETPENPDFGDYSTNLALQLFSRQTSDVNHQPLTTDHSSQFTHSKSPRELAGTLVLKLQANKELMDIIDRIEVAGPGFINFYLNNLSLTDNLKVILEAKEKYGRTERNQGKTAIVEYSSANIAKPFTVGHLRSTIIGDAIANLMEATGWKVMRDNHLGDWGTQFGKQIYAIKTWGNEEEIVKSKEPVHELVDLYVKYHAEAEKDPSLDDKAREWFKKLEEGDPEARRIWQFCIDISLKEFDKIYGLLGVKFSQEFNNGSGLGESFFEDKMKPVIAELEEKGLLKEGKEGAKLVFFENDKYPPAMILKKDGTTLYHTRDLATDKYRKDIYHPDVIVNEVGADQILYFQQLFEIEKMLGWFSKGQRVHIYHGFIRFKDGKMSTRKGNVVWMEDVLEQAIKKAKGLSKDVFELDQDKIAQKVGIGALKYNDLKRDPKNEIIFDWDEILNMEGNSGPYLQYTYARTHSVIEKALGNRQQGIDDIQKIEPVPSAYSLTPNPDEHIILSHLLKFTETIEEAARSYSPNLIANYLFDLAQRYNAFYNKYRITNPEDAGSPEAANNLKNFRVALTAATGQVLKNGLYLLGIETPERM